MLENPSPVESILALDVGSVITRAFAIGPVDGQYRLISHSEAPTTLRPPWNDLMPGVRHALGNLHDRTGWRLLDAEEGLIFPEGRYGGIDAAAAVCSAGGPSRYLLMGITGDMSLAAARRVLLATSSAIVGTISMEGESRSTRTPGAELEGQVRTIRDLAPDTILIAGGPGGSATQPLLRFVRAAALGCAALPEGQRPSILFAGDEGMRSKVSTIAGAHAELRFAAAVHSGAGVEDPGTLLLEVEELSRRRQQERVPGYRALESWSPASVLPAAQAYARSMEYLARLDGVDVLGANVGASATSIVTVVDEQLEIQVRTDLGLRDRGLIDLLPVEAIARWLPFEVSPADLRGVLLNRGLYRGTVPQTAKEMLLEQALAREVLRRAAESPDRGQPESGGGNPFQLIVGGGGILAASPNYGQAALMLLDALQPTGVTGLALDALGLVSSLAAVAAVNPVAAAEVMERDGLRNLGTVVAPVGRGTRGEIALTARIERESGPGLAARVPYGSLHLLPLPDGEPATLELLPTEEFDVGLGTKGQAARTRVRGGALGIIIDARGRPLEFADTPAEQRQRVGEWHWSVGA